MVDWRAMADLADAAVDEYFGDPLTLIPWLKGSGYVENTADTSRAVRNTTGVYVNPTAVVKDIASGQGGARMAQVEMMFSLIDNNIAGFKQGDRAYLPKFELLTEITFIEPGDTGRSLVHMVRLKTGAAVATRLIVGRPIISSPTLGIV